MMTRTMRKISTPAYRETRNRLSDIDWNTSPQNLLNWADKGAIHLNKLIPALKKIALQDGAILLPFYMYLDNELMDIEHLCCMAHARVKWNQIFAYRNDGEYFIDNMAAERAIRPITDQRKNDMFFGSVRENT